MISFKVPEANDQTYQDYCLMFQKAKGSTKGRLTKEVFISKLRKGLRVKLPNSEFKVEVS